MPENYKVIFVQGGASTMFASNALNLCPTGKEKADFVTTGAWSKKALGEAKKFCDAGEAATSKESNFSTIPERNTWNLRDGAKFVHICENETIGGVEFKETPVGLPDGAVLVADHSSNYLSKPIDVNKYGIIYGGVQKNIACAGMGIAIIREDLIGNAAPNTPTMLDFSTHSENESMYNTPPCYVVHFRFSVRQVIEGRWFKRDGKEKPREGEGFVRHDRRVRWLLQLPDGFEIQIDDERSVYVGESMTWRSSF